jgi:hypothetical protein
MTIDQPGQEVVSFASALLNASRVGTYADLVVKMFHNKAWREYETALGVTTWRVHEFDYFLISCGARYEDMARIMLWDTVRSARLVEAMTGEPSRERRALAEASETWQSGSPSTLIDLAQTNGWLRKDRMVMRRAPVSRRAALRAAHGTTKEARARQHRRKRLGDRRQALDALVRLILSKAATASEVAYIIDQLRASASATKLRLIRSKNQ